MSESTINIKSEDLNEAIRKAANEQIFNRSQVQSKALAHAEQNAPQRPSSIKSELERALDARLRRSSMITSTNNEQQASLEQTNKTTSNQKNDLPPPPSPHSLHRLTTPVTNSICSGQPPPPPPPLPSNLFKPATTTTTTGATIITNKSPAAKPAVPFTFKPHVTTNSDQQQSPVGSNSNREVLINASVRSIVSSMQISNSDPRLSSDFSALIGNSFESFYEREFMIQSCFIKLLIKTFNNKKVF